MSSYSELIKSFERIRTYMRDFYIYGFRSREEFTGRSARTFDDERRRVESWLGDYMGFSRTADGKAVFLSIDSREVRHNPLYRAWRAKSFTDRDITLHFILLDILHEPEVALTLPEILDRIDRSYLADFSAPLSLDESTVRKKLKEYAELGIVETEKQGRRVLYRRSAAYLPAEARDAIDFFSEAAPCGVIGSFAATEDTEKSLFTFKHHYITAALDSEVLAALFCAMGEKRAVGMMNSRRGRAAPAYLEVVPLRIRISTQSGRHHLLAYQIGSRRILSYRLDYLSDVKLLSPHPDFDALRDRLTEMEAHLWGVNCGAGNRTEHVEFTVRVQTGEEYIVNRLEREKRCGRVERVESGLYRFSADVYSTEEMLPWIRTFLCRIASLRFSNRTMENRLREDLEKMCRLYGVDEDGEDAAHDLQ